MTRIVLSMMAIGRSEVYSLLDLGFLEGGFRFRWITAIRIVTLCQAKQNTVKAFGHAKYSEGVICLCRCCEILGT